MNQENNKRNPKRFPLESFPNYLEDYIEHYNDVMRFDVNAQAMTVLVHSGALLDKGILSFYKDKFQRPIIWGCVVQKSSTGKSNILEHHTDFLVNKDCEITESNCAYVSDEATFEAIIKFNQNNSKGILARIDELETLILGMDNYSKGNKSKLMTIWSGDQKGGNILRKGEDKPPKSKPKLSMIAFTQPSKLITQLKGDDFYSGFSSRFLFCLQYDNTPRLESSLRLNPRYINTLNPRYERMWKIPSMEFHWSDEANEYYNEWYNDRYMMYHGWEIMESYMGKINTYGMRIAPILHALYFADTKDKIPSRDIPLSTIIKLTEVSDFFISQYKLMLENRYSNYEDEVLNMESKEFVKCYKTLIPQRHYTHTELKNHFKTVYSSPTSINARIKNTALFKSSGKAYLKNIHDE